MSVVTWLKREPQTTVGIALTIIQMLLGYIVVTASMIALIELIGSLVGFDAAYIDAYISAESARSGQKSAGMSLSWYWVTVVAIVVPLEEFVFRAVPLYLAARINQHHPSRIVLVAIISSVMFGRAHGGWDCVLIVGMAGLMYSALYLKCGGMRGAFWKPLLAASLAHFGWDCTTLVVSFMWLGT